MVKKAVWSVFSQTMLLHSRDTRICVLHPIPLGLRTLLAPFINLFLKLENKKSKAVLLLEPMIQVLCIPPSFRLFSLAAVQFSHSDLWVIVNAADKLLCAWLAGASAAWTCWQFSGREGLILQRKEQSVVYKYILYYSACKKLKLESHFPTFFCINSLPRLFFISLSVDVFLSIAAVGWMVSDCASPTIFLIVIEQVWFLCWTSNIKSLQV